MNNPQSVHPEETLQLSYSFSQLLWCISDITIYICTTVSPTSTTFSHLCTS